jgi:hypothetical protein
VNSLNSIKTVLQVYAILIGTTFSSTAYVILRINGIDIDVVDKFWCALPTFASLIATNRCIFGRIVRFMLRRRS